MDNKVIIKRMTKGNRPGLSVIFEEDIEFDLLKKELATKMERDKHLFYGSKKSISFSGRELSDKEQLILVNVIAQSAGLEVTYIEDESYYVSENKVEVAPELDTKKKCAR